ncbi:hypothetical protein C3489_36375 [Streptomyces sp. Ru71]|uniref:hypothetical protein n=1 Tax=Streptomyces sp. Ru71 TaxID=2080746 RepID=UPI000CDE395B|nr:hypothetical protein [Streptomyces sp. Ru71]POX44460.1 hypothetical protein C3489_36375 [Streptomyces sp. Ru71]
MPAVRKTLTSAIAATILAAGMLFASGAPASAATCPSSSSPKTTGGEASWTMACVGEEGRDLKIYGWVEDTAPDNRCARVTIKTRQGRTAERTACGYGVRKQFSYEFDYEFGAAVKLSVS